MYRHPYLLTRARPPTDFCPASVPLVPPDPTTDLADWDALRQGHDPALDRLIARWQRPLVSFAFRYLHDASEARALTAETFIRLYRHRARLNARSNPAAWLFTTLANLCHNHSRWRRRHPTVPLEAASGDPSSSAAPSSWLAASEAAPNLALQQDELVGALQKATDNLSHDLRATLLLHHYEHLSYREIGAILGCSERGVETRLYRARRQLREQLQGFLD
jgi:RNA polymerase sigma-70 factor, ECF subfamily